VVYSPCRWACSPILQQDGRPPFPRTTSGGGNPQFQEPAFGATLELVEGLRPIAKRLGITLAQLSLAWVLRRPEVTSAIGGARKPSQIERRPRLGVKLSESDAVAIEHLLVERENRLKAR
jgi:aryl-alcohol dehydrogenase-like predicted oxidoreductase